MTTLDKVSEEGDCQLSQGRHPAVHVREGGQSSVSVSANAVRHRLLRGGECGLLLMAL